MRSNTIFAAGFVAASAVMAAPVEVRADNAPLIPASQGVQTESTGPLIPTTSASQAPLTTETTGSLIPTTSASASGAQTTETTGPLIPTTTASGSASASSTGTASHSSTASGSGTATSSGTATGTSTASSSSGTGTASSSSTGTASHSGSGTATGTATSTATASSTASASGSGSASGSSTGPAPTSTGTVTVTGTGTQTVNPPVTSVTPPPQVLTVLTTITEDFTEYVTYVPVTITNGGSGSETITVTQTVTEQNTVTVDGNGNGCAPTGTSTQTPPPPPHPTGSGSGSNSFYPSAIYHYDVSTGAITCGVEDGLIEKFPTNKGQDITTLVTFTYPEESAGKKCQFEFFLSSASTLEGSGKIDVFTSLAPAPGCKAAWPPGNQRNVHAGRLSAHVGAFATWDATYGASYLTEPTDCKAPGTQEGIELVGVYDEDHVAWFPDGSGARIIYN